VAIFGCSRCFLIGLTASGDKRCGESGESGKPAGQRKPQSGGGSLLRLQSFCLGFCRNPPYLYGFVMQEDLQNEVVCREKREMLVSGNGKSAGLRDCISLSVQGQAETPYPALQHSYAAARGNSTRVSVYA
jgi:hypothetical protein